MAKLKAYKMIPRSAEKGAQAVYEMDELIRCEDCKHGDVCIDETGKNVVECSKQYKLRRLDWFCADGIEKEGR